MTPSDPIDCSPPAFPIHGIFQARVLEWDAMGFLGGSVVNSLPILKTQVQSLVKGIRSHLPPLRLGAAK